MCPKIVPTPPCPRQDTYDGEDYGDEGEWRHAPSQTPPSLPRGPSAPPSTCPHTRLRCARGPTRLNHRRRGCTPRAHLGLLRTARTRTPPRWLTIRSSHPARGYLAACRDRLVGGIAAVLPILRVAGRVHDGAQGGSVGDEVLARLSAEGE